MYAKYKTINGLKESSVENKKILVLTYYWPPAGGPGVQRWLKFVKYLPVYNIDPVIITVDEKYATYPSTDNSLLQEINPLVKVHKTKTFELFSLYQRLFKKQDIPHSGFVNEGNPSFLDKVVRFVRSNLFIPDPRKGWNRYAVTKAFDIIKTESIHCVITTGPPHSTHLAGLRIKKKFPEINWISDLRDPWTDIYYYDQLYHSVLSRRADKRFEKKVTERCDKLVVVGESMKKMLLEKYKNIESGKIHIIPNGYDPDDFKDINGEKPEHFTITYTGTLAHNYNISAFLKAVKELNTEGKNIKVRFIGKLSGNWITTIKELNLTENIEIHETVPHTESIKFLIKSHLLLLVIPENRHNKAILTGKIFEYIAVKKPVLNIGPVDGDAAIVISENEIGETFNYNDLTGIKTFITEQFSFYVNNKPQQLPDKANRFYTRNNLTGELVKILF